MHASHTGHFRLSTASIHAADLPPNLAKKLLRCSYLPVTLLGRLAIDQPSKGQGLGQFLLLEPFTAACRPRQPPPRWPWWWSRKMRRPRGSMSATVSCR